LTAWLVKYIIAALRAADRLDAVILQRHAEMKERKAKLLSLYKFTPNRRDREAIELVMKKLKLAQDQIGVKEVDPIFETAIGRS
jgi:hypothetical protein